MQIMDNIAKAKDLVLSAEITYPRYVNCLTPVNILPTTQIGRARETTKLAFVGNIYLASDSVRHP